MKKITTLFFGLMCLLSIANAQNTMLFDFDTTNANITFQEAWNGTWPNASFAKVANPDASGINTSANVGKFTSNGGANATIMSEGVGSATLPSFDIGSMQYFSVKVWVSKPVSVSLYFANNGYYPGFAYITQNVTTTNQWVTVQFDCAEFKNGGPHGWGTYNILGVCFDKDLTGGTVANDVYYFDDIQQSSSLLTTAIDLTKKTDTSFSVYPNPAQNYILTPNTQKVSVCDLNGCVLKESFNAERVDISSFARGTYIVKTTVDNNTKVGKLIKK